MSIESAIKTAVVVKETADDIIAKIKKLKAAGVADYNAWKGLDKTFSVTLRGNGIGKYEFRSDPFEMIPSADRNEVKFNVYTFEWFQKLWNGVSLLKDKDDGGYEASLIHDLIAHFLDAIAAANNVKAREVELWSDKILVVIWAWYAKKKGKYTWKLRLKLWAILHGLYIAPRGMWRNVVGAGGSAALVVCLALTFGGCIDTADYEVVEGDDIEFSEKPVEQKDAAE